MKKILFPLCGALLIVVGCDVESAMDKDLYPEYVYIVGVENENPIIDRELDLGIEENTITVSVAVSGSRPSTKDVTATVMVNPDVVEEYNFRELTAKNTPYRDLDESLYSFPSDRVTIKAGTIYNTFPIRIQPGSLHCDSLYMLALQLRSASAYDLNREDTVALVRLNLVNDFSGLYYMDGKVTNPENESDYQTYSMPRNLTATDDGRTVRMYHYNNEYIDGDERNYRPTHTFKITVNEDNTLSLTTWDKFALIDGGGEWVEEWETYKIWYMFDDSGTKRRTDGFLYKERTTDEELRLLQNWIEEERAKLEEEQEQQEP